MPKVRRTAGIAIDALLAAGLVAVMATALVEEVPHEFLGVGLFALIAAHLVVNRRFFTHLAKGRYVPLRVVRLVVLVGLAACVVGQVASALVLSKHAFAFLPSLPGASLARRAHLLCSYWCFVLAFVHAGLQVRRKLPVFLQVVLVAAAFYGAFSFIHLGFPGYLFGQAMFAAADYSAPLALVFVRYASVAALIFSAAYYLRGLADAVRSKRAGAK